MSNSVAPKCVHRVTLQLGKQLKKILEKREREKSTIRSVVLLSMKTLLIELLID